MRFCFAFDEKEKETFEFWKKQNSEKKIILEVRTFHVNPLL